ncbi:MAG TPA: hypothetical protein QF846_08700, partial [Acidimicrobiales bacterium]|nr:hypothetical protein [Acidimicrobiales bacterium]
MLTGSIFATVVDVGAVVVVVVATDVCVVGGVELEEGTFTFIVVLGGAVVREVEDSEVVEVVVEVSIGSKLSLDIARVVI